MGGFLSAFTYSDKAQFLNSGKFFHILPISIPPALICRSELLTNEDHEILFLYP